MCLGHGPWEGRGGGFAKFLQESRQPRPVHGIDLRDKRAKETMHRDAEKQPDKGEPMALDDEFAYHEALDRTYVLTSAFDDHVLNHPVIANDPELKAQAEKAEEALGDLYQLIGLKTYEKFPGE